MPKTSMFNKHRGWSKFTVNIEKVVRDPSFPDLWTKLMTSKTVQMTWLSADVQYLY